MHKGIIPIIQPNPIGKWLDNKVSDHDIMSKYEIDEYTIRPYYSYYEMSTYYDENDSDMKKSENMTLQYINNSTEEELEEDKELLKLSQYADHILLYPNTNRYHANSLFRQLIDYSYNNNYDYNIYDPDTRQVSLNNLMDKALKKSFYKFCYDNTYK
ncbi:hypothetical protein QKU48_gp0568 [Fadolivirus algeromassiliense]|jgi:hypothetical protein|uniref:Uncharacterized protein n=1 Tax=Fadolivirus FV1/VV64 TaxID=3070911 RepID=A0A7D3QVU2_9VIRU|nr:hypothetical protein QKU48_gp0568 [Fadolivirus algeromassiliense]QKF94026.1 hypothetical protein Fadolivirus_1_568 [Fadolivirus FV1/VV64]